MTELNSSTILKTVLAAATSPWVQISHTLRTRSAPDQRTRSGALPFAIFHERVLFPVVSPPYRASDGTATGMMAAWKSVQGSGVARGGQ
jgi:hypothetical protein